MPKVVTPINAQVVVIGREKEGEYGPYRSVLFADLSQEEESEEGKIWQSFDADDPALSQLRKGMQVQLVPAGESKNGKTRYSIVIAAGEPSSAPTGVWTPEQKRTIADKVGQYADLMAYCLQTSRTKFVDAGLVESEDSLRNLATTLFIQAMR